MRFVSFLAINTREEQRAAALAEVERQAAVANSDNVLRLDDLERPISPEVAEAVRALPETELTYDISINADMIREVYARRNKPEHSRIVYANGAAQLVAEPYADVIEKLRNLL